LDSTFGSDGWFERAFVGTYANRFYDVAPLTDGRIVAVGTAGSFPGTVVLAARLTANGVLDPAFDGDGWTTTAFGTIQDYAMGLVVQPDGKYVVAGATWRADYGHDVTLVRYTADGQLDETFGTGGRVVTPAGTPIPTSTEPPGAMPALTLAVAPTLVRADADVRFVLPAAAAVLLALYDPLGRRVVVLTDGDRSDGGHVARLDASHLAPGVYVLRLESGARSVTTRVTVVR
jgi:uncharacterized delta-60 repeat protein